MEIEREINLRMAAQDSLKYYHSQKTLEKKTKSIWWVWYLLGFATCFGIYNRKTIISFIKKIV